MRLERIFARQRSKYRPTTTDSRHGGAIAPNRVRALVVRTNNHRLPFLFFCLDSGNRLSET
jgi:hypothetical protein